MTLTKSLLLGSAAAIVAVASANAADLPTRKGPVAAEYVRVCSITVAGAPIVGFVLPGSDTCFKISGYVTGQVEGGNLSQAYSAQYVAGTTSQAITGSTATALGNGLDGGYLNGNYSSTATTTTAPTAITPVVNAAGTPTGAAGAAVPINTVYTKISAYRGTQNIQANSVAGRDSFGFTTRMNTAFDAVSNTAFGPLVSHAEIQIEYGSGFDNTGTSAYINRAYVTWAGITAGRANSFFSFTGGGLAWANFFSPDRKGFNQPDLLAYTASFGGGFAATISIEDPESGTTNPGIGTGYAGANQVGSDEGFLGTGVVNGMRVPDVVAALSLTQAWGSAQISGVAHNVRGLETVDAAGNTIDKWGYGVDAGIQFNIPGAPAGSQIGLTGAYTRNATWYSGIGDGMWDGTANDNGQPIAFADAYYNLEGNWATPTAWSVTGWAQYQISPQVSLGLEGSYGEITWSGQTATSMISNEKAALIGGIAHYDPVKNLDFEFELLYEDTKTATPNGYVPGNGVTTTTNWHGDSNGFAARFEVTRNF